MAQLVFIPKIWQSYRMFSEFGNSFHLRSFKNETSIRF